MFGRRATRLSVREDVPQDSGRVFSSITFVGIMPPLPESQDGSTARVRSANRVNRISWGGVLTASERSSSTCRHSCQSCFCLKTLFQTARKLSYSPATRLPVLSRTSANPSSR